MFETKKYSVTFTSRIGSELFFGKAMKSKKENSETHEQFEERCWQEKVNVADTGQLFIQPFALKNALSEAGRFLTMKIPGEGKKTFTDRFKKGVLIVDRILLCLHDGTKATMDDIVPIPLFVPSDGKQGSGRRVTRIFPSLAKWKGTATIYVHDGKITEEVLETHLECCGQFIGFGSMRVANGGINGTFLCDGLKLV
jgi:hypothetical protein